MGKQSEKQKPLLHRVRGSSDPQLHSEDLWWFFNCYDHEALLKGQRLETLTNGNARQVVNRPEDGASLIVPKSTKRRVYPVSVTTPYNDWHVTWGRSGAFTRGKRIWSRFSRLRWGEQELLRQVYTGSLGGIDDAGHRYGPEPIPEALVRALHRSYYGLEAA